MQLNPCPICNKQPYIFSSSIQAKGCSFEGYVVECDSEDDQSKTPFIEHTLTVYGSTQEEAENRWQEISTK